MNRRVRQRLAAVGAFLVLLVPSQVGAQNQKEWTWKDREGKTRTREELEKILAEHKLWVESGESRGSRADLTGADLTGAQLPGVNLQRAHLRGTRYHYTILSRAQLKDAHLENADLHDTALTDADLSGAVLYNADLSGAYLLGANFDSALVDGVDFEDAVFEPNSMPETRGVAAASHLDLLTYEENPDALVQLRKQFEGNGFRSQERKITYALSRKKAQLDGPIERRFQTIAFDWTCKYGMKPGRALQIWLALLFLCWLVYAVFIHVPGVSGIYQIQKTGGPSAKEEIDEPIRLQMISTRPLWRYPYRWIYQELRVLFWAGFFSLMSAFNIGFRDINFGRWLRLLPRTEYDLKAKGWARTVAGFQSLISVYLIGLWVLTYFGRPFE